MNYQRAASPFETEAELSEFLSALMAGTPDDVRAVVRYLFVKGVRAKFAGVPEWGPVLDQFYGPTAFTLTPSEYVKETQKRIETLFGEIVPDPVPVQNTTHTPAKGKKKFQQKITVDKETAESKAVGDLSEKDLAVASDRLQRVIKIQRGENA